MFSSLIFELRSCLENAAALYSQKDGLVKQELCVDGILYIFRGVYCHTCTLLKVHQLFELTVGSSRGQRELLQEHQRWLPAANSRGSTVKVDPYGRKWLGKFRIGISRTL